MAKQVFQNNIKAKNASTPFFLPVSLVFCVAKSRLYFRQPNIAPYHSEMLTHLLASVSLVRSNACTFIQISVGYSVGTGDFSFVLRLLWEVCVLVFVESTPTHTNFPT